MRIIRTINLLSAGVSLMMALAAQANTVTFVTPTGSTAKGEAVDASAVLTTGTDSLSIALSNLLSASQMKDAGQLLSDLSFTLMGVTSPGSVTSSTGTFIDVGPPPTGTVTSASSGGTAPDLVAWGLKSASTPTSTTYVLDGLAGKPSLTPANLIIGGTAGSFTGYTNLNSSVAGNKPHNPVVQGTADWVLSIPGVSATTNVSSVVFSFSTTSGVNVTGMKKTSVPEPATFGLFGLGLAGLVLARRKRKDCKD